MTDVLFNAGMKIAGVLARAGFYEGQKYFAGRIDDKRIQELLQPFQERLSEEILSFAEAGYDTAVSHLKTALLILESSSRERLHKPESEDTSEQLELCNYGAQFREQTDLMEPLPEKCIYYIRQAITDFYRVYHNKKLSLAKRIRAMQLVMICICLDDLHQFDLILARWTDCVREMFSDKDVNKCVYHYLGSKILKIASGYSETDFESVVHLLSAVFQELVQFNSNRDCHGKLLNLITEVVRGPEELSRNKENRCAEWRKKLQLETLSIRYHVNPKVPHNQAYFFTTNKLIICIGSYITSYAALEGCLDRHRNRFWYYSKDTHALINVSEIEIKSEKTIPCAIPAGYSIGDIIQTHFCVSELGVMVMIQVIEKDKVRRNFISCLYLESSNEWISSELPNGVSLEEDEFFTSQTTISAEHAYVRIISTNSYAYVRVIQGHNLISNQREELFGLDSLPNEDDDNIIITAENSNYTPNLRCVRLGIRNRCELILVAHEPGLWRVPIKH